MKQHTLGIKKGYIKGENVLYLCSSTAREEAICLGPKRNEIIERERDICSSQAMKYRYIYVSIGAQQDLMVTT